MKCLFLDPASNIGALCCVADAEAKVSSLMDKRISDSEIVPLVEKTMKDAGWTYADLTHLACVTGPGGFTSLRTGVAFVNVLQDQLNLPVAGIHLSDLYAVRVECVDVGARHAVPLRDWIWLHSTRIDQLFVRGFGSFAARWPEPVLVSVEDLAKEISGDAPWAGELIPRHREALKTIVETGLKPLADVLPGTLAALSFGKKPLLPWYGRTW